MVHKIGKTGRVAKLLAKAEDRPEWQEQAAVIEWARINEKRWPELKWIQGSLNGIYLSTWWRNRAKSTGYRAGFPDLFLPVVLGGYCGWFCEMKKRKGGRLSPIQKQMLQYLNEQGYRAIMAKGSDEAIADLEKYFNPCVAKWED